MSNSFNSLKSHNVGIVRFLGFLLVFVSLSWLVKASTNNLILIGLGVVALLGAIFAFFKKSKFASLILFVFGLLTISLYFFSPILNFMEVFADVLTNQYIYPVFLLVVTLLLLIVGTFLYKIIGFFLLVALFMNASEFLVNLSDIFNFLAPLSQYDISISGPLLFVLGVICLLIGQSNKLKEQSGKLGGYAKYVPGVKKFSTQKGMPWLQKKAPIIKDIRQQKADELRAKRQERDEKRKQENEFKKAQSLAIAELTRLQKDANVEMNPKRKSQIIQAYNERLLEYQRKGLVR